VAHTLLHFTDTHLYAEPQRETLKGFNTTDSLIKVLNAAWHKYRQPAGILLGGDLTQDDSMASYVTLQKLIESRWHGIPVRAIPGNHDVADDLENIFGKIDSLNLPCWRVVCVNSQFPGHVAGRLSAQALIELDQAISCDDHVLIMLHHPPVLLDSPWMDEINLKNADAFWRVLDKHSNVRGVLFGHAHQEFEVQRKAVRVMGSPSTCLQFMPGSEVCEFERVEPGYRWLELHEDGSIQSGIERIEMVLPEDLTDTSAY